MACKRCEHWVQSPFRAFCCKTVLIVVGEMRL